MYSTRKCLMTMRCGKEEALYSWELFRNYLLFLKEIGHSLE